MKWMSFLVVVIGAAALMAASPARAAEGGRLLVLAMKADPADATLVDQVQPELVRALQSSKHWAQILVAADLGVMVQYDELRGMSGCNDDACRTRLDELMADVDEVVASTLRTTGDGHQLEVLRLNARNMQRLLGPGPSESLRTVAELKNYARESVQAMTISIGVEAAPPGRILIAAPDMKDLTKTFSVDVVEQLTVLLHTRLSGGSVFVLYPRDKLNLIRETMRDPTAVLRVSRAQLLLETEVVKKDGACAVTARTYDTRASGVSQFGGAISTACDEASVGRALEEMVDSLEQPYLHEAPPLWPAAMLGGVAVVGAVVGGVLFSGAVRDVDARNALDTTQPAMRDLYFEEDGAARDRLLGANIAAGVAGAAAVAGAVFLVRWLVFEDTSMAQTILSGDYSSEVVSF